MCKKVVKNHMMWDHFCRLIEKKTFFKKNPLEFLTNIWFVGESCFSLVFSCIYGLQQDLLITYVRSLLESVFFHLNV